MFSVLIAWFGILCLSLVLWVIPVLNNVRIMWTLPLPPNETFDFIIVGGGSAGCIVAGRLATLPGSPRILLLEAGPPPVASSLLAPIVGSVVQGSALDWQHLTVPQRNACLALEGQMSRWPGGKLLGGTTHLNYMLHVPGLIQDFADWSDKWDHWGIRQYLRYTVKKMSVSVSDGSHGKALVDAVWSAAKQLNLPTFDEPSGVETLRGFTRPLYTIKSNGARWTADEFLPRSNNLVVRTGAKVQRLLISDNGLAYGVEFLYGGQLVTSMAKHEVILSAGTINSAHLLMVSGIGPESVLKPAKIKLIRNLPVGRNLQDHVTTGLDLILSKSSSEPILSLSDLVSPWAAFNYFMFGIGPWSASLCQLVALLTTNHSGDRPDLQLMVMLAGAASDHGLLSRSALGIKHQVWEEYWVPLFKKQTLSILPVVLRPRSVGTVTLNADEPAAPPLIDPRYLTDPHDVQILVEGLKLIYKIVKTDAMRDAGFRMNRRILPGCETAGVFASDSYWNCYVRHLTLTSYHPVGTCSIGPVLDHKFRVHGTRGLRVVDASVMPSLPAGNTHAAVAMLAHMAVDSIAADWMSSNTPCRLVEMFLLERICQAIK